MQTARLLQVLWHLPSEAKVLVRTEDGGRHRIVRIESDCADGEGPDLVWLIVEQD